MKTKFIAFTTAGLLAFGLSVWTANAWCWLTGGGTIDNPTNSTGVPDFSFGGVVNPGCSPTAASGGNWNVIDHRDGLHFKGKIIVVDGCSGTADKAPPVQVNVIDFEGAGILTGIDGNPMPPTAVCFQAEAQDHGEPGAGADQLYLRVYDCSTGETMMLISSDQANPTDVAPVPISTGNLQVHTIPCNKYE